MSNLNTFVNTLRKITPKPNAQTNCGKLLSGSNIFITFENAKQAANNAIVSITEVAVM